MMSRWKEAQTAFEQGKAQWQGVQQQMSGVGTDGIMEVGSLLSLNSQKPGVEWLAEMQRRLAEVTDYDPEVCRVKTELAEIEDTVQNYRDFLRNYRMQKESFRRLIKSCVDNSLDLEAYVASVEDWRQVRELLIESPLFEVQLVKEFVALDCIFQILYYMAGPNGSEHNKYKSQISYLISKWDVEDLLVEQEFSAKLLDNFFSNSKNRFSMLGKREMSAHSSPNQTNSESLLLVKKKLSLPFTTFTPVKESAIKLRNDCLHSDDLTSTKRFSGKLDWSKASTRLTNMDAHIQYDYNRQLADMSKSLTDMSYNELCDTVKNKDIEEQQKVCLYNLGSQRTNRS